MTERQLKTRLAALKLRLVKEERTQYAYRNFSLELKSARYAL